MACNLCLLSLLTLVPFTLYLASKILKKMRTKSIENKHVLVIGGSSGIGKAYAKLAVKKGAHVTIAARNETNLQAALKEISEHKVNDKQKLQWVSMNASNFSEVQSKLSDLDSKNPIYMLVNCAGLAICGVLEDLSEGDIETLTDVNLLGTIYPLKVLVPKMKERKEGVLVLTSSQGGLFGIFGLSVYAATKFALRGLAEGLRMEVAKYDISVTVGLPPDTDTPGFENENKRKPLETQMIAGSGGLLQPEEVAGKMLQDALEGNFFSFVGFESFMLTNLCVGASAVEGPFELLYQLVILGPLRLVMSGYLMYFDGLIKKCKGGKVE